MNTVSASRPIDANALANAVHRSKKSNLYINVDVRRNHNADHDHFLYMIASTPSIDVVPVVRCKDCKYRHSSEFCECREEMDFCSDGELK